MVSKVLQPFMIFWQPRRCWGSQFSTMVGKRENLLSFHSSAVSSSPSVTPNNLGLLVCNIKKKGHLETFLPPGFSFLQSLIFLFSSLSDFNREDDNMPMSSRGGGMGLLLGM